MGAIPIWSKATVFLQSAGPQVRPRKGGSGGLDEQERSRPRGGGGGGLEEEHWVAKKTWKIAK
jgi:hypothetical protein